MQMAAQPKESAQDQGPFAIVVDPWSSGATLAPALRARGFRPVAVVNPTIPRSIWESTFKPEHFEEVLYYEGSVAEFAEGLRRFQPACVIAGAESGVELADALAAILTPGLANVPALSAARRHKARMGEAVAAAGLPHIRQICTDDLADVEEWVERNGLSSSPLVLKPPKSAGTDGVVKVEAGGNWRERFVSMLGRRNKMGGVDDQILVQEYASGDEYVVDSFSHNGRHTVTDLCRYKKPSSAGNFAIYEHMDFLPPEGDVQEELVSYAFGVLDALGIRFGPAHMEVMMTADGPRMIETGARMHGVIDYPEFCRLATGESQLERMVRFYSGDGDIRQGFTLRRHVRIVFLIGQVAGVATNAEVFDGIPHLASFHKAFVKPANGKWLPRTTDLFTAQGYVILVHEDEGQILADYSAIRRMERELVVDDGPVPGGSGLPAADAAERPRVPVAAGSPS